MSGDQSTSVIERVWKDRNPSHTEAAIEIETARVVDDTERDIDEIMAICQASAISATEALKA